MHVDPHWNQKGYGDSPAGSFRRAEFVSPTSANRPIMMAPAKLVSSGAIPHAPTYRQQRIAHGLSSDTPTPDQTETRTTDPAAGRSLPARGDDSPEATMARFQRGDARAFATIVARYKRPIVGYLYRMTGDRHWAEDLAQDVFVRVFNAADSYQSHRAFTPWLYAIARNMAIDFLRRPWRRSDSGAARAKLAPSIGEAHGMDPADPADPEALATSRERAAAVRRAIESLSEIYREAVVLCDLQGLSYKEAAEVAGIPAKTVSSRLARGRAALAEKLRHLEDSGRFASPRSPGRREP